jgi:hypothetical protein
MAATIPVKGRNPAANIMGYSRKSPNYSQYELYQMDIYCKNKWLEIDEKERIILKFKGKAVERIQVGGESTVQK